MKKLVHLASMVLLSVFLTISASAVDVYMDGVPVVFDDNTGYPFISAENRTLVPLRVTMEAFGATVRWDAETRTALVTKNETTVAVKIGENRIFRNGTEIPNDAAAVIVNGRTYLPIRAVLEALDATVGWNGSVLVTSPGAGTLIYEIENSGLTVSNYWAAWENAMALKDASNYAECVEKMRELAPVFLEKSDYNSDAMFYHHLGYCYDQLNQKAEAAACYTRESELWELAGLHQESLDAARRASFSNSTVQMFVLTDNAKYAARKHFGALYEPYNGVQFGVTLKGSSHTYMTEFTQYAEKEAAAFILYGGLDTPISTYQACFTAAKQQDKIIQYALQPNSLNDLLNITADDARLIQLAKDLQATGAKILIRFACEMNEISSKWYTEDYAAYIRSFRYAADIFHTYAPNCAMVWSPNFYPADNMEYYYPGDAYVDYVGISAYYEYAPETDPLQQGIDRSRFEAVLDTIVGLYGHKKPIIISEGGASYYHVASGKDITELASQQLHHFITYLPIKYPQVSAMYLFETVDAGGRKFELNKNEAYRKVFVEAISSEFYVSHTEEQTDGLRYSFELGNNVRVGAETVTLCAYFKTFANDFSYAVYAINGVEIGRVSEVPYALTVDLSAYRGQTITLTATAYDSSGAVCASKSYAIVVE